MPETKDLTTVLANTENLAEMTDEQLEALAAQHSPEDKPAAAEDKGDTDSTATPGGASEGADDQLDKELAGKQPDGIESKDGKHVIPYWRLADAEEKARQAQERIKELEKQINTGSDGAGQEAEKAALDNLLSDEELESMEADFPVLGKILRGSQQQIRSLTEMVNTLRQEREDREEQERTSLQDDVEKAIQSTPKLAHLRANDTQGYDRAVQIDQYLRGKPEWADRPFAERFAKVVALYEAEYGGIDLPSASPEEPGKGQQSADTTPLSMSAIPGGSAPPVNEAAALLGKSGPQLTAHFLSMTQDQIEAELSRV